MKVLIIILFYFPRLFILYSYVDIGIPFAKVFQILSSLHYVIKLFILLSLSFNYLLQVPPSLEGVKLIEQRLLEEDFEEVFSLFTTLHDFHVLTTFVFLKLILSPLVLVVEC
jgi:hypothetical protein